MKKSPKDLPWNDEERAFFRKFRDPVDIQEFLNRTPYNPECTCCSPRLVIRRGKAHCFEGAMFAAAALRNLGYPPMILDMMAVNDDDHVIAVFRRNGCWGSIAKSNFTTLRFREPVYLTIRELVMSYFDFYFNTICQKTLRSFSRPVNLSRFDSKGWMTSEESLEYIGDHLNAVPHRRIMNPTMEKELRLSDPDLVKAGLLGSNPSGLFTPKSKP